MRIEGVTRLDRVRNEDISESLGQVALVGMMKERQRRWKEKVEGLNGDRLNRLNRCMRVMYLGTDQEEDQGRVGMITLNRHVWTCE